MSLMDLFDNITKCNYKPISSNYSPYPMALDFTFSEKISDSSFLISFISFYSSLFNKLKVGRVSNSFFKFFKVYSVYYS